MTTSFGNSELLGKERLSVLPAVPVSRETAERLYAFVDLLGRWRSKNNLLSDDTFFSVWTRHIADSAQILSLAPGAKRWVDIGSGAGFPGMVLALQLADVRGAVVHCVESDPLKCAFLREVARATCCPAVVHSARIQSMNALSLGRVDGITARAFAPLSPTLDLASQWLANYAVGVFPRGRSLIKQFVTFRPLPHHQIEIVPSIVDSSAAMIRVRFRRGPTDG